MKRGDKVRVRFKDHFGEIRFWTFVIKKAKYPPYNCMVCGNVTITKENALHGVNSGWHICMACIEDARDLALLFGYWYR